MNNTFQNLMRKATELTQSGRLGEATELIQRLLNNPTGAPAPAQASAPAPVAGLKAAPLVLDDCVFEVPTRPPGASSAEVNRAQTTGGPGEFISASHSHANLTRNYKLYIPPGHPGQPLPLVVMLHGCTQNPDDFAAGTGMNQRAQTQGFFVLYPEQSSEANPQACWNWFRHKHQERGSGEPALIASLTQAVVDQYGMDGRRVYVAGLSAGGAMAAVMAAAYPDRYAAVGVHSGLPAGAASNVAQALLVMKSGHSGITLPGRNQAAEAHAATQRKIDIPTIVFHGDEDKTVHPRNGDKLIATVDGVIGQARVEQGLSTQGRRYTRSTRHNSQGGVVSEHWLVHGAGHAWSGGLAAGSYTDPQGPDASAEMLRFFFSQQPRT